ncbi:MAG: hypothetical protein ACJ75M_19250, partial [Actinomycetes bacterium]
MFGATFACLVGGLVVTLFVTRPLTAQVLVNGAFEGASWLLFATIGLVLTLRRPGNPIGWLYAAAPGTPGSTSCSATTSRWRQVAVASVAGTAATVVGWVLAPDPMTQTIRPVPQPFPLHGVAGTMANAIHWIGWGVLFACIPVAAVSLVLRFRASRGTERQQLRWVAAGATGAVAGPVVGIAGVVVTYFAVICLPLG